MKIPDIQKNVYLYKSLVIIVDFSASSNYGLFAFKSILLLLSFPY